MSNKIDLSAEMQDLANIIAQYAPDNWTKLCTSFEPYEGEAFGIDSYAEAGEEKIPLDFDEEDIDSLEKIFRTIRNKTMESWKVAEFSFNNNGDSEMNFQY